MAQIRPGALDYRLDWRRPGYRVIDLLPTCGKVNGSATGLNESGTTDVSVAMTMTTRVERLGFEACDEL